MRKFRIVAALILAGALIGLALYFRPGRMERGNPNLSLRSGEASPSAEFLNAQRSVEYYRDAIRKKPEVVKNYVELAQLFFQEARVTANEAQYLPKVQSLLEKVLRLDPDNFDATVLKASVLMSLHQFHEAKNFAEKAAARNPHNAFVYGLLCDANVELGQYDEAVRASDHMQSLRPDLRSYSRASYLRELHGDLDGACEAMKMAADAGAFGSESRAWTLYQLGNLYLGRGKLDTAAFIFDGILQERPSYASALRGLAEVKSMRGEFTEAIVLLRETYQRTPEHHLLEDLAAIYRTTGDLEKEKKMVEGVISGYELEERMGANVDREYAMFCADHDVNLAEVLRRIEREYGRRPQNIDVLDTYAWVLYKGGRATDAVSLIERAMRLGTQSSALHYHAAMIYYGSGDIRKSLQQLDCALRINPYPTPLYAESTLKLSSILAGFAMRDSKERL